MSQFSNEPDSLIFFMASRIVTLNAIIEELTAEIDRLSEYEWMYKDLCR